MLGSIIEEINDKNGSLKLNFDKTFDMQQIKQRFPTSMKNQINNKPRRHTMFSIQPMIDVKK